MSKRLSTPPSKLFPSQSMGRLQDKQFIASSRKRNKKTKTANSPESDREKLEVIR